MYRLHHACFPITVLVQTIILCHPVESAWMAQANQPLATPESAHTVHMVYSHHLDIGLDLPGKIVADCSGFATEIIQRYFDVHIPRAIHLAQELKRLGMPGRFSYQVHAWIAHLYVYC